MSTGVYLLSSTDAAGVLFRQTSGLSYDTVAIQLTSTVYLVHCGSGQAPAWHTSPCPVAEWTAWLPTAHYFRSVRWIPATDRTTLAQFVATTCLSTTVWPGWVPARLGDLLDRPSTPVDVPVPPLTPWERLVPHPSTPPAAVVEHAQAWVRSLEQGLPPVVDLNPLLASLGLPTLRGPTSAAATFLLLPPEMPRTVFLPETPHMIPLWRPSVDALTYAEIEQLSYLLHTPAYLPHPMYDELREVCQKKLSLPTKRWLPPS